MTQVTAQIGQAAKHRQKARSNDLPDLFMNLWRQADGVADVVVLAVLTAGPSNG